LIEVSPQVETLDLSSNCLSLVPRAQLDPDQAPPVTLSEALSVQDHKLSTLILAWNRLGRYGAFQLAEGLLHNKELTTLDLRHNGIDERGACVLADAILRNDTLQDVNLDSNPLGIAGCAEIIGLLQSKDPEELHLSVDACGWTTHDHSLVDFDVPSQAPPQGPLVERVETNSEGQVIKTTSVRRFKLDLSHHYDRFAAHRLADIGFGEEDPESAWVKATLGGHSFVLPQSEPEPDNDWLPREGILEFDYLPGASSSKVDKATRHKRRRRPLSP
jgi:hypothetical protein